VRRTAVDSRSIAAVGYDDATNVLDVEFTTGYVYRYFGVPRSTVEAVLGAESVGRAFNVLIRGRYPFERLE
jgi:hypothetical protein